MNTGTRRTARELPVIGTDWMPNSIMNEEGTVAVKAIVAVRFWPYLLTEAFTCVTLKPFLFSRVELNTPTASSSASWMDPLLAMLIAVLKPTDAFAIAARLAASAAACNCDRALFALL